MSTAHAKLRKVTDDYFNNNVEFIVEPTLVRLYLHNSLKKILSGEMEYAVFDTETTSLDPWADDAYYFSKSEDRVVAKDWGGRVFAVQFGFYNERTDRLHCLYIDVEDEESMDLVQRILACRMLTIIGHNIKFDIQMCSQSGIEFNPMIWDTLTATRLTHDRLPRHDLKWLGNYFSGNEGDDVDKWEKDVKAWLSQKKRECTKEGYPKEYVNYSFVPNELMHEYALKDIWYTFLIFTLSFDEIYKNYEEPFEVELEVIWYLVRMERRGIRVDRKICEEAIKLLNAKMEILDERIDKFACANGNSLFNPNSPKQLKEMIVASGIPESALTRKGGGLTSGGGGGTKGDITKVSTARAVLERTMQDYPQAAFLQDILDIRTVGKVKNTYFESINRRSVSDDIVHCNLKASDTATGRVACVNPNLQNIPRPQFAVVHGIPSVRRAFIARIGFTDLYFDYSQIEMRLFALYCRERAMLDAFEDGRDLHTESAVLMFGKDIAVRMEEHDETRDEAIIHFRRKSKILNFAILYGMGITKLSFELGVTFKEGKKMMEKYNAKFPNIATLTDEIKKLLARQGYIEGIFGRRYHLPKERAYVGVNALIQGDAAMVLKVAQLQTERLIKVLRMEGNIIPTLVVHDEQKVEIVNRYVNWIAPLIKLCMEDVPCVLQYGITTTVDVEWSHPAWDMKMKWKSSASDTKYANKWWGENKHKIIIPWTKTKVDWFLEVA